MLVHEGAGNSLEVKSIGKDFFNITLAVQQVRERMDKWDFIKLKISAQQKNWSTKETTHRVGENIFQLYIRYRTDSKNIQGT
jgi:hypothetical protein